MSPSKRDLLPRRLGILSTDGLWLSAPSKIAWVAESPLAQGHTLPRHPTLNKQLWRRIKVWCILPQWETTLTATPIPQFLLGPVEAVHGLHPSLPSLHTLASSPFLLPLPLLFCRCWSQGNPLINILNGTEVKAGVSPQTTGLHQGSSKIPLGQIWPFPSRRDFQWPDPKTDKCQQIWHQQKKRKKMRASFLG